MSLPVPDTPTRNRSASTGDSGLPQHEHKRPRLSDVQGDLPRVEPPTAHAPDTVVDSPDSTTTAPNLHSSHAKLDVSNRSRTATPTEVGAAASSTSSKVTINTRPLSSQSSTRARTTSIGAKMNSDSSSKSPSQSSISTTTNADPTKSDPTMGPDDKQQQQQQQQTETISISSSENDSPPPIEVAAPEDFDQDPSETQWEPVSSNPITTTTTTTTATTTTTTKRLVLGPTFVQRTFPYANTLERGSAHQVINILASSFMNGTPRDGPLLKQVSGWLQDLVAQAPKLDRATLDSEHEFWEAFPSLATNLLRRDVALPPEVDVKDLVGFFIAFVRLTKLVADVETSRFRLYPDNVDGKLIRPIITHAYTQTCRWIFTTERIPLYNVISESYGVGPLQIVDNIIDGGVAPGLVGFVDAITDLFDAMAPLLPKKIALVDQAMNLLQHCGIVAKACATTFGAGDDETAVSPVAVRDGLMRFLEKANSALERAIVKQHPWLTIENWDAILGHYEEFISNLTCSFPEASQAIIAAASVDPADFSLTEMTTLAILSWRFSTLRKFVKNGRMELRVCGIGAMADELVKIFLEFINSPRSDRNHPTVRFMVQFIRKNELIRYIIGVDSHPQIINRSQPVVGFLCVSHTYTNEDTDIIWKTAMECQDPRAGAEVLQVLQSNLEHLNLQLLYYVTLKLLELPFSRFNSAILEFAHRLIIATHVKLKNCHTYSHDAVTINIATTQLCLHLLRQANTLDNCAGDLALRIRHIVPDQVTYRLELTRNGSENALPPEEFRNMITNLCQDLETHSPFACGSVYAISQVLRSLDPQASVDLIHEHSLTQLVIEDLVHLSGTQDVRNRNRTHWMDYDCYFTALPYLILQAPDCFDEALLDRLWLNLLSSKQLLTEIRSRTWTAMAGVLETTRTSNPVMDVIISRYLPRFASQECDEAVLNFVQQSVRYEARIVPPKLPSANEVICIPGIERVWTIMLESASSTVESAASDFIIREYLDSTIILGSALSNAEATHLALIERCVQQSIDAANNIKEVQSSDQAETEHAGNDKASILSVQGLKFHRSLQFLRRFLEALKATPRFTPSTRRDISQRLNSFPVKGETIELKLQIHNHPSVTNQITRWAVGLDNSASDIWSTISSITGWSQFTVIYRGARADFKDNHSTLKELSCTAGLVMVSKLPGSTESAPDRAVRGTSPVDSKVMHHFDDLYNLLDLGNEFAREVYGFLTMFSSKDDTLSKLRAMNTPAHDLLQVEKPYKLMYYLRALRSCIEDESFNAQPDTAFITYAIRTVISTLNDFTNLQADTSLRLTIVHGLMEALMLAFRAKVPGDVSRSYVVDHASFLARVLDLWSEVHSVEKSPSGLPPIQTLIRIPFEVFVEATLHDETLWSAMSQKTFIDLLLKALLRHPVQEVRQAMLDVIYSMTGNGPVKSFAKAVDTRAPRSRFPPEAIETNLTNLWNLLSDVVPTACEFSESCLEFFDACTSIFKVIGKKMEEPKLKHYALEWKPLLLQHKHQQYIGFSLQDHTISAFGRLILECLKLIPAAETHASDDGSFGRDLFSKFLFPPLSDDNSMVRNTDPILDTQTRQVLYDLILAVSLTPAEMKAVVTELNQDLVPKDYYFAPVTNNDRLALRSEVGYSGLKNLSNTCYLNSLFSQLFMNVEFRDLIMNIQIVDESKQKLVVELSKVFAHMQNSYEEAISPEYAVDAITQWDGDQIDVTIQMDVDEFFNLLFDRLEFQILDRETRNLFKSIYGGQLVQQIKSKECEHVSETLEPFSAVQVEIKGKSGLEESLKAYVEGEVLQGENKYSCTGCGKHVDAVKRACLKDVPDHLIFNLKRFDFDIMTGMRCKVNDEFQFPVSIDMGPYQLDALSNPGAQVKPDIFELAGIIVHSGTAESGHYYSYIRKRPSAASKENSWVQFNDQDVTKFDPATIRDCCFGGVDYGAIQCPKFYNGYMLFYQRTSSLETFGQKYPQHSAVNPIKLGFAEELDQTIALQNELYLRSFVAQDPTHAKFVKSLLQRLPAGSGGECSPNHHLETQTITMVLDYINTVSARWKDLPEVDASLKLLEIFAVNCESCAQEVLRWSASGSNLGDNLVRCCYPSVRKAFAHLICVCLKALTEPSGRGQLPQRSSIETQQYEILLEEFIQAMHANWDIILRHGRAWEQYFGVLSALTRLGTEEVHMLIDQGFLERTLELVHLHVPSANAVKRLKARYQAYLTFKERNRPYGHASLIQFLADLLPHIALDAPINGSGARVQVGEKLGLIPEEAMLFELGRPIHMLWLRKIILGGHNLPATDVIVAYVAKIDQLDGQLCECLKDALLREGQIFTAVSFLRPALTFILHAVSERAVSGLVEAALESIETTAGQYGKDYLTFVAHLLTAENHEIPFEMGALRELTLQAINKWAPVLLMQPNDIHADVRGETLELLKDLLFQPLEIARTSANQEIYEALLQHVDVLLEACAEYAQKTFLDPPYRDNGMELQAGQANHVLQVVETYLPLMMTTAGDEEKANRITGVMDELKVKSDNLVDDMTSASEWKASSDLEALSDADLSESSP